MRCFGYYSSHLSDAWTPDGGAARAPAPLEKGSRDAVLKGWLGTGRQCAEARTDTEQGRRMLRV